MGMNAYGGALTLLPGIDAFHRIKPSLMKRARVLAVLALTLLWYFVGESITANAVNTVFTALTLMLYLLVPWTATNLIDFFFVRKGHYAISEIFNPKGIYGSWSWRGLLAYVVGFLFEIPFMVLPQLGPLSYTGPIAKVLSGVDISWLVGLATTAITYLLVTRSLDTKEESLLIAKSNEDLQNSFS
jgi:NCS1 family nucleobase:cation symporter-1